MSEYLYKRTRRRDLNARKTGESWMPYRPFFWSLSQVASMVGTRVDVVRGWCFFRGRSSGVHDPKQLLAVNMAPPDKRPHWCVEDRELRRYFRARGVRLYGPYQGRYEGDRPLVGDSRTTIDYTHVEPDEESPSETEEETNE